MKRQCRIGFVLQSSAFDQGQKRKVVDTVNRAVVLNMVVTLKTAITTCDCCKMFLTAGPFFTPSGESSLSNRWWVKITVGWLVCWRSVSSQANSSVRNIGFDPVKITGLIVWIVLVETSVEKSVFWQWCHRSVLIGIINMDKQWMSEDHRKSDFTRI